MGKGGNHLEQSRVNMGDAQKQSSRIAPTNLVSFLRCAGEHCHERAEQGFCGQIFRVVSTLLHRVGLDGRHSIAAVEVVNQ